jgi:hypothetical protein
MSKKSKSSRKQKSKSASKERTSEVPAVAVITEGSAPLAVTAQHQSSQQNNQTSTSAVLYQPEYGIQPNQASLLPPNQQRDFASALPTTATKAVRGVRQTQPSNLNPLGTLSYNFIPRRQWQGLDVGTLEAYGNTLQAQQLLELAADFSAEIGQALWNKIRLVNTGWNYKVMTANGKRELKAAKSWLDEWLRKSVNPNFGGLNTLINSWTHTAYLQGAIAGELELSEDLTEPLNIYSVQPYTIYFQRDETQALVPFQLQAQAFFSGFGFSNQFAAAVQKMYGDGALGYNAGGTTANANDGSGAGRSSSYPYIRLNSVTFKYLPLDAPPDDPYGRPPAAPALQYLAFDLQMLTDIRIWAHANAWGRVDISVVEELILKNAPPSVMNDPTGNAKIEFVNNQMRRVSEAYASIGPDDAYFHTDAIKVNHADASGKGFDAVKLVLMIERKMIRALKELPVFMGSNEGTTETHGSIQLEIYARGIGSIQSLINSLLESLCTVALQVVGYDAVCVGEFAPMRTIDRQRELAADKSQAELAAYKRDQGWITQDDASIQVTGSEAVGPAPAPAPVAAKNPNGDDDGNDEEEVADANSPGNLKGKNKIKVDDQDEEEDEDKDKEED